MNSVRPWAAPCVSVLAPAFLSAAQAPVQAAEEREQIRKQMQGLQQRLRQLGGAEAPAGPASSPAYRCQPANPNATPEARAPLKSLCAISGNYILSGQHNFPAHLSQHSDTLAAFAGKYPAVWGSDFGFTGGEDKDSVAHRQEMIDEAKRQAAQGSIITLCWHMLRPTEDEPGTPGASWRAACRLG